MAVKELYVGLCVGGPLDGHEGMSRFPNGFVYADKPNGHVWVYDYYKDGAPGKLANRAGFIAREQDLLETEKLQKAANEPKYDVRAYDPELHS